MNKLILRSAVFAATVFAAASANAAPLSVTWTNNTVTYPATDFNPTPASESGTGTFTTSASGNVPNTQASPWTGSSTPLAAYSCIDCALTPPGTGPETVTYNNNATSTTFQFLWGSPDAYNSLTFVNSDGITADNYVITGNDLNAPVVTGQGHDWVTFIVTGGTFTSVQLFDNGTAAFEYADATFTPLPAALPLFAGGLGMIGLLGRRRKRQAAALPA
jgi:hypothetical protein